MGSAFKSQGGRGAGIVGQESVGAEGLLGGLPRRGAASISLSRGEGVSYGKKLTGSSMLLPVIGFLCTGDATERN